MEVFPIENMEIGKTDHAVTSKDIAVHLNFAVIGV